MTKAIVLLGAPNDEHGNLSLFARSRCDQVLSEFSKNNSAKILCTGGFGEHFNQTNSPHACYTLQYLQKHGIPEHAFTEPALSRFTLEDATLAKPILAKHNVSTAIVVTSDFHVERVKFIFETLLPDISLSFVGAKTPVSAEKMSALIAHEKQAIQRERETLCANKSG